MNRAYCWPWPCVFALASSKPRLTCVCLTNAKELAGLSKLELDLAHTKINQINLSHKTAWNPGCLDLKLHIKRKKNQTQTPKHIIFWFSNFKHAFFAVSIPADCFLALEQSLMSKYCQKPRRKNTELREFFKKGLSFTTTGVGVWHYSSLRLFQRTACKSDWSHKSSKIRKRNN